METSIIIKGIKICAFKSDLEKNNLYFQALGWVPSTVLKSLKMIIFFVNVVLICMVCLALNSVLKIYHPTVKRHKK